MHPLGTQEKKKIYTWEEVRKHNVEQSCWLVVRDRVYDVTSWIAKHPGGVDALLFNAVHLCFIIELFFLLSGKRCYHPF
jgi:cytochrome b involved in lipid metabolism